MSPTTSLAIVSVSGGKDSTATALLALDRYGHDRCRFVFADTGNEHELTLEYVQDYLPRRLNISIDTVRADFSADIARKRVYVAEQWPNKGVPAEVVERALSILHPTGIPFLDLCLWKGRFPSRKAQFCTQELKRRPLDKYLLDLLAAGLIVESWQGVRRDESDARRDAAERERAAEGWWIERPIVDWSAQQTVDFVLSRGVQLNPLYSQGHSRVGCYLCINECKDGINNASRRHPHHIDKIREWERLVGMASKRGFSTLLHHADGEGHDAEHAFRHCNIDAMVAWSRTAFGGRQFDLLKFAAPPSCSSTYGLCE
ncbi:phosphoadenosine phosphosulfate reductase family protein [Nitrospirillum viridazoti]|uniref:Phosphoadenosine phosphosulfate reductase n=1 Tax=Nitrospirillum viridazoti CBAmc TaxID=1441467 RepID=A0A248JRJ9_9PROT|nr:phosphoadenosine phosphosulfate reductase family protein [Nitrospirillum amazonense]ASG21373.1 phosphoadenosine phosphosulfate reductase [Nitrospirillum amazonense CBAmc]TWB33049.1 phosphoadenosine phosphosulfate reductase family protein [Nitrospirillum amazonense]